MFTPAAAARGARSRGSATRTSSSSTAITTASATSGSPITLWSIDSEIYYVDRRDLVVFTARRHRERRRHVHATSTSSTPATHDSYGLEALIKREISEHAYGWLSYTFSRARQTNAPATTGTRRRSISRTCSTRSRAGSPAAAGSSARGSSSRAGRPDTPVIGATFDADCGCYVAGARPSALDPHPDVHAARRPRREDWLFEHVEPRRCTSTSSTSTNRENDEAIQYDYRFRKSSPVTSFPILPTIGVRGTW